MRIGIDCRTILHPGYGEQAGVGHYTYFLVKHILEIDKENQYVLFFDKLLRDEAIFEFLKGSPNALVVEFPFHKYKKFMPYKYSHILISAILQREKLDVYHNPANIIPIHYNGNSVITIHDLAIFKYPQWFSQNVIQKAFSKRFLLPRSIEKAKKIIAISNHTKKDIMELFDVKEEKIEVIYNGVHAKDLINAEKEMEKKDLSTLFHINDSYILFVGTIEPRKNLVRSLKAFEKYYKEAKNPCQFVICGAKGWKYDDIFKEIARINKENPNSIKYLGYVDHASKLALMKHAKLFVFPSLYEGFGLPVLEAFEFETPAIISKSTSLEEIAKKGALLVDPYNEQEIYEGLNEFLVHMTDEQRRQLGKEAKKQSDLFSWNACANETLQVYMNIQ